MPPILLASGSIYRRELLARLRLPFDYAAANIDESPLPGENGLALASRLAQQKAHALADQYPEHLIIGSDQVAVLDDQTDRQARHFRTRPGSITRRQRAQRQLPHRTVPAQRAQRPQPGGLRTFTVHFRELDDARIERYLRTEQPYDCAAASSARHWASACFAARKGTTSPAWSACR